MKNTDKFVEQSMVLGQDNAAATEKWLNQDSAELLKEANKEVEAAAVNGYKKIEDTVVGSYKKIEDAFVGKFLVHDGETIEQAKERLRDEEQRRREG